MEDMHNGRHHRVQALGRYIRRRRGALNLSLREVAKRLNCSHGFISHIELGRRHPSERWLSGIARVLAVKVKDLRAADMRPPINDIVRIANRDRRFTLALRAIIENKVSADELLAFAGQTKTKAITTKGAAKAFRAKSS